MAFVRLTSGQKLFAPKGARPSLVRARKSLFDKLTYRLSGAWADKIILDGFAGSGALGFESLLRGARQGIFIDSDREAVRLMQESAEKLHLMAQTKIICASMMRLFKRPDNLPCADIVFLDPPYYKKLEIKAMATLFKGGWITKETLIVLESAADDEVVLEKVLLQEEIKIGDSRFRFLTAME